VPVKQTQKKYQKQNSMYVSMPLKSQLLARQKCVVVVTNTDAAHWAETDYGLSAGQHAVLP